MNPYIQILRPNIGALSSLGVLVGVLVSEVTLSWEVIFALAAAFFIASAGNVLNDYFDVNIDGVNKPERPIPSGRVSRRGALRYAILLNVAGVISTLFVNLNFFTIAVVNVVVASAYASSLKKTPVGNVVDSYLAGIPFVAGGLLRYNFYSVAGTPVMLLGILAFIGNLSRELFKDVEDMRGDKKMKARTLPLLFGKDRVMGLARLILIIAGILLIVPVFTGILSLGYVPFLVLALVMMGYALAQDEVRAQKILKAVMFAVMLGFIAGSLG